MTPSPIRCRVAAFVALTTGAALLVPSSWGAAGLSLASLGGRVVEQDGITPRSGVVVSLVDDPRGLLYESEPTGESGSFLIAEAPAGAYSLVVRAPEGAFQAPETVRLEPGRNPPLALALRATGAGAGGGLGSGRGAGLATWSKWLIAGVIAVAAVYAIDDITKNEEEPASGF